MCGRYALALRPSQIRLMLEDDNMSVDDAPADEGDGAPRQSYNFAPGYHGVVYRADVPDHGAGPARSRKAKPDAPTESGSTTDANPDTTAPANGPVHYKLQSMKWGLVPFWTKRNPDYATVLKTINCRDDSLATPGGMWATMKARKRCIVVAQGFYEWLKVGARDKVPHHVRRKDGKLMCFAGLWDCVRYDHPDDDKGDGDGDGGGGGGRAEYTYTIITTSSNERLKFLHDRMPVIFDPGSEAIRTWLDPGRYEWTRELQDLLVPYKGELEVYPVAKEVGKVGNNSPSFVVPVASVDNKQNIANFFAKAKGKGEGEGEVKREVEGKGVKREAEAEADAEGEPPVKKKQVLESPVKEKLVSTVVSPAKERAALARPKISATKNAAKSPMKGKAKGKADGSQKITQFFNSA